MLVPFRQYPLKKMSTKRNWVTLNFTKIGAVKSVFNLANKWICIRTFHCIVRSVWKSVKANCTRWSLTSLSFVKIRAGEGPFFLVSVHETFTRVLACLLEEFKKFPKLWEPPQPSMHQKGEWMKVRTENPQILDAMVKHLVVRAIWWLGSVHQKCTEFHMLS